MPPAHPTDETWPELLRVTRTIVVVDVVESVRLMQANEADVIDRWRRFVHEVRSQVLPAHAGRMVKSLGDGMLLEFDAVRVAVDASLSMQAVMARLNGAAADHEGMALRVGVHRCEVVRDDLDIYGVGVNLAARLAGLAGAGEVVVSSEVRDELLPGLDPAVQDLGDCYLKHLDQPVRAWRLLSGERGAGVPAREVDLAWKPMLCVLPLSLSHDGDATGLDPGLGGVVAAEVVRLLQQAPGLRITGLVSAQRLNGRDFSAADVGRLTGAQLVVQGRIDAAGGKRLGIRLQALDCRTGQTVAEAACTCVVADPLQPLTQALVESVQALLSTLEIQLGDDLGEGPIRNIGSYSLMLAAIARMHRMSMPDIERAHLALGEIRDRHPRAAAPMAWHAKLHMLRIAQSWTDDRARESARAVDLLRRALDIDARNSLALAIQGQVQAYQFGDLAQAERHLDLALQINPSEAMAWMFASNVYAFQGRAAESIAAIGQALALSPLDPARYMLDCFAAYAYLCAGQHDRAQALGMASLAANRLHLPSYPVTVIAMVLGGHTLPARKLARQYLRLAPEASASRYAHGFRGSAAQADRFGRALREAGFPH